jgi:RHS repeat-associated protein
VRGAGCASGGSAAADIDAAVFARAWLRAAPTGQLGRRRRISRTPSGDGQGALHYLLADHLGSTSTLTDATGAAVSSQKYWPYGAVRSGSITQTDKLYTGQQIEPGDSALGLYNYKARFYSTTLGRFVSAAPSSRDGLNRYSYVRDNPLRYRDPTGYDAASDLKALYDAWQASGMTADEYVKELVRAGMLTGIIPRGIITMGQNGSVWHVFSGQQGHLSAITPENIAMFEEVAANPDLLEGVDVYGSSYFAKMRPDGSQIWVQVRGGVIKSAGINPPGESRTWDPVKRVLVRESAVARDS